VDRLGSIHRRLDGARGAAVAECVAVKLCAAVWSAAGLRPLEKLVLLRLADRVNGDEYEEYLQGTRALPSASPGVRSLAADCGMSRPGVLSQLHRLRELGFVKWEEHRQKQRPWTYFVLPEALSGAARGQFGMPRSDDFVGSVIDHGHHSVVASIDDAVVNPADHAPVSVVNETASRGQRRWPEPEEPEYSGAGSDAVADVLQFFSSGYQGKVGEPYVFDKRARERAAQLLSTHPPERIHRAIGAFFASADPWYADNGFPFAAFVKQFDKIAASALRVEKPERTPYPDADATARLLRGLSKGRAPMPDEVRQMWRRNGGASTAK
jgi:hypothetical protein